MLTVFWIVLLVSLLMLLCYHRASMSVSSIMLALYLLFLFFMSHFSSTTAILITGLFLVVFIPLSVYPIRRYLITRFIMKIFIRVMPRMSDTEREALEAGTVGWTGELFSGMPNWHAFNKIPSVALTVEEKEFLEGPVEQLCGMLDSWSISRTMQIPNNVWQYIRDQGFFGMIIPKQYGGKEFSAMMHSEVITKLASVCSAVSTVVSVPNSLGPAELLLRYGSSQQKEHYLPRLAVGEEVPCFALTSRLAGSDASSIVDYGVVFKEEDNGVEHLKIRLNWDKRYITLAPVATLIGLAFKLYDPDHLLGQRDELGITCALIAASTKGITVGRRHFPLHSAFPNGPIQGQDVIISIDDVIGGKAMVGQGWRMLMECLATGRSISLPSIVAGGIKKNMLASGAYCRIRRQFNTYIGSFGGIQESLARIVTNSYQAEALRTFTVASVDQGQEPVVESAISKYHVTELGRKVLTDAFDIHGGKAICMGPSNYLAQDYIESPISITVEGANILTRSMIIFGQGAMRCHPYILKEIQAAQSGLNKDSLTKFDRAIFSHLGMILSNKVRSFVLAVTGARMTCLKKDSLRRQFQLLTRFSAAFAFLADVCMISLGAKLKRMENISARLGDILSYLYIVSAMLKFYNNSEHASAEELSVVRCACDDLFYKLQTQIDVLLKNLPSRLLSVCVRLVVLPLGKRLASPHDSLIQSVASSVMQPTALRERFAINLYTSNLEGNPVAFMDSILAAVIAAEPLEKKLAKALVKGLISGYTLEERLSSAVMVGVLSKDEASTLLDINKKRLRITDVDDFSASMD